MIDRVILNDVVRHQYQLGYRNGFLQKYNGVKRAIRPQEYIDDFMKRFTESMVTTLGLVEKRAARHLKTRSGHFGVFGVDRIIEGMADLLLMDSDSNSSSSDDEDNAVPFQPTTFPWMMRPTTANLLSKRSFE